MKKIVGILGMVCLLTACGGKEKTTVCEGDYDGMGMTMKETLTSKGDEITEATTKIEIDTTELLAGMELSDDEIMELIATELGDFEAFNDIKGVTSNMSINDGVVTIDVQVDYTKADIDELIEHEVIEAPSDEESGDYFSLESTVSNLEKQGLTCKEK